MARASLPARGLMLLALVAAGLVSLGCVRTYAFREPAFGHDQYFLLVARAPDGNPYTAMLEGDSEEHGYPTPQQAEDAGRRQFAPFPGEAARPFVVVPGFTIKDASSRLRGVPWSTPSPGAIIFVHVQSISPDGRSLLLQPAERYTAEYTTFLVDFAINQLVLTDDTRWCGGRLGEIKPGGYIGVQIAYEPSDGRLTSTTRAIARAIAVDFACRDAMGGDEPLPGE